MIYFKELKYKITGYLLRKLLVTVDIQDVIRMSKGVVYLGNQRIGSTEVKALQSEIKFIEKTRWWKVCQETLAEEARKVMFEKAVSFEQMQAGKLILHALEVQRNIASTIKRIPPM